MKTNQSILDTIKTAVENLEWNSETKKQKALNLCISIFNLYIYEGGDFNTYKELSKEYFISIIKTMNYVYEIKNNLVNNGILEVYTNNQGIESYDIKGKAKGYRFNQSLINGQYNQVVLSGTKLNNQVVLSGTKLNLQDQSFNNLSSLINLPYHICGTKLETSVKSILNRLYIKPEINDYISNFNITRSDIKVNNEIVDEYVKIVFDNNTYRYKLENALKQAEENGLDLIQYKDKCYIDSIELFLIRKTNDLRLIYRKSKFDIENKIFRVSRNQTNMRLDYNLTNMKSSLLNYIELDGEELVELDIANAQFSILAFITNNLDKDFIEQSQNGTLYNTISKDKWFRVAFDKIKSEQNNVRDLYPQTMEFIDNYKKENGYKSFSNLLQRTESLIMIDGLLNRLLDKGYDILPIHDAIRVKKSQVEEVKNEIELFFNEINFKCLLRIKIKESKVFTKEIINYKNFKNVEIDKVSTDDKKLFISMINALKKDSIEPSEDIFYDLNLWKKEKTWYLYTKWRKNNPYQINEN